MFALDSAWIRSKSWDFFWILANLWLFPIALFISPFPAEKLIIFLFITHRFALAHLVSPVLNSARMLIKDHPAQKKYWLTQVGILILVTSIFAFFACGGAKTYFPGLQSPAFTILLSIYILWTSWHIGIQHYGILSLYAQASKNYVQNKTLDKIFAVSLICLLTPSVWARISQEVFSDFVKLPTLSAPMIFVLSVSFTLAMVIQGLRTRASIQTILYYICIGITPAVGAFVSATSQILLLLGTHWLGEVGLSSRLQPGVKKNGSMLRYLTFGVIPLLLIGSFVGNFCSGWLENCGSKINILGLVKVTAFKEYSAGAWFGISFTYTLPYLHYLLSRYLYKNNRAQVVENVANFTSQKVA